MNQPTLTPALAADLQQVDAIVRERVRSRQAVISAASSQLAQPDQPRPHAAMVLLSAAVGTYRSEQVVHAAAAVELILAATGTHDLLVDTAARRRGTASSGEWNHGVALMVGDYLFALAAVEMALSPDPRVIGFYAQAVMRFAECRLATAGLRPLDDARAAYFECAGGEATAFYGAACRAGAACGGLADEQIAALGRYGHALGLALHLNADIRASEAAAAPLFGLPLIFAVAHGDGERLSAAFDGDDPAEAAWAAAEVRRLGLLPARDEARRLADKARAALAPLPDSPARAALLAFVP